MWHHKIPKHGLTRIVLSLSASLKFLFNNIFLYWEKSRFNNFTKSIYKVNNILFLFVSFTETRFFIIIWRLRLLTWPCATIDPRLFNMQFIYLRYFDVLRPFSSFYKSTVDRRIGHQKHLILRLSSQIFWAAPIIITKIVWLRLNKQHVGGAKQNYSKILTLRHCDSSDSFAYSLTIKVSFLFTQEYFYSHMGF